MPFFYTMRALSASIEMCLSETTPPATKRRKRRLTDTLRAIVNLEDGSGDSSVEARGSCVDSRSVGHRVHVHDFRIPIVNVNSRLDCREYPTSDWLHACPLSSLRCQPANESRDCARHANTQSTASATHVWRGVASKGEIDSWLLARLATNLWSVARVKTRDCTIHDGGPKNPIRHSTRPRRLRTPVHDS